MVVRNVYRNNQMIKQMSYAYIRTLSNYLGISIIKRIPPLYILGLANFIKY